MQSYADIKSTLYKLRNFLPKYLFFEHCTKTRVQKYLFYCKYDIYQMTLYSLQHIPYKIVPEINSYQLNVEVYKLDLPIYNIEPSISTIKFLLHLNRITHKLPNYSKNSLLKFVPLTTYVTSQLLHCKLGVHKRAKRI